MLYNLRLKHKIALLCIVLVVVSTSISGILLYRNAAVVTTDTASVHSTQVIAQVNNYLNEKLKGIITRSLALRSDTVFNETAARFLMSDDPRYYSSALSYFSSIFLEMRYSEPFISSVFLYTPKGSFYDLTLPHNPGLHFPDTAMFRTISAQKDASVYWLPRSTSELYRDSEKVISLILRFSVSGYNEELYMVIHLKEQRILEYLSNVQSQDGSSTMIVDSQGDRVVSSDSPIIQQLVQDAAALSRIITDPKGSTEWKSGADSFMISYTRMNVAPWTLVHIQSQKALLDKLRNMKVYSGFILLISITVSLGVAFFLSATISRPLVALERTMKKVRLKQFDVRFDYPYDDEVGKLGKTFNFMTEEIDDLIGQQNSYISQLQQEKERVQTEQRLKRIAELKALHSQMTPHFLYNTLDSIKWMAEKNGQSDIARMITALATFFRTALSRGKEIISIEEELGHAVSYLTIQKMRYEDRFIHEIQIDEPLKSNRTVKFILQPLVENAIYHGIKQQQSQGKIRIVVRACEEGIRLSVEDNGPGIHPVKLKLIQRRLELPQEEQAEGYGLFNVNDRLKLHFGEAFGLDIHSELGKGTTVTACIPYL
jgi:two-component system, sensor histidine kinase YesM